jgi:hypothetical protein
VKDTEARRKLRPKPDNHPNFKQPLMVRTFLKVYMELGSSFLFLQEQIKDIIIIPDPNPNQAPQMSLKEV